MTPRHAMHTPPPRRNDAAPPQAFQAPAWPAPRDRDPELRGETLDESECFEQLLMSTDAAGQGAIADQGGDPGGNGSHPNPAAAEQETPAPPCEQTAELWRALLARLDERLATAHAGAVEAQLELPNLGLVAVRVLPRGSELEIVLGFAETAAWRSCDVHRQASAAWLGEQLGRRVKLTLQNEAH